MTRLAVIGHPIKHSVSPAMQQAALNELGVVAEYRRVEVAPSDLAAFVADIRAGEWAGANVTVPHKESILPMMDRLSPEAAAIGAVNTVVRDGDALVGHNTDARGFLQALGSEGGFDPAGRVVAVMGAGGAARAVLWSLCQARARRVLLINRDRERAERLAAHAADWGEWTEIVVEDRPAAHEAWQEILSDCDAVVNATSVGLTKDETPLPADAIPDGALVVDLIYTPRPTPLLAEASARGLRTLDGLPMLVYQGAAAFELWTGMDAPLATMFAAAEEAVGGGPPSAPGLGIALLASRPSPEPAHRRSLPVRRSLASLL